jgi:hypothetical protein
VYAKKRWAPPFNFLRSYRVVHKLRTPFQGVLNTAYNPMMASMLQQRTPIGGS